MRVPSVPLGVLFSLGHLPCLPSAVICFSLQALREVLRQKDEETQRLESLCTSTRESWHQQEQTLLLALKEKEALVKALQGALSSSTKDVEVAAAPRTR